MATTDPILAVRGLDGYYGRSHALQAIEFEIRDEPVAIIGRNGMGKTSLCRALMNLRPPHASGSVLVGGRELGGRHPHEIARAGVGYVPQGRKLFPSLSVDEHLRMLGVPAGGRFDVPGIYALFPRLAERKQISATQLSGGEQQMLAIGRALLLNPRLLIMDEPSEGLAPRIVEEMVTMLRGLVSEGVGLLLIEQNLGVATAVARRQLVMVAGRIFTETTADELQSSPELQQRFLGVTRLE